MSTAPTSIQPRVSTRRNSRVWRIHSDGSGSSGETVTARPIARIITTMRTFSRARLTMPRQKTSCLRTANFSRAKTI